MSSLRPTAQAAGVAMTRLVRVRQRIERRWPELTLVAALVVLFFPFLSGQQVLYWGTPLLQFYPWHVFAAETVRAGHMPLWNPWVGGGAPFAANYQVALFYPPYWLTWLVPVERAHAWLLVGHLVGSGLGMMALARRLGFTPLGVAVAGLAFGLGQYMVGRSLFQSMNAALAWTPWVIWAVEGVLRATEGPSDGATDTKWQALAITSRSLRHSVARSLGRSVALLAGIAALQLLAGHAQSTWYTWVLAGAWLLWRVSQAPRRWPAVIAVGAGGVLAAVIAAVQLIPTFELLRLSQRSEAVNYELAMTYSFSPWRLLTLIIPDLFGNPARGEFFGYGVYFEDAVYAGALTLVAALGSVFTRAKADAAGASDGAATPALAAGLPLFLAVVAGVSLVLALGQNTPLYPWLYTHVPTFSMFQAPARWSLGYAFAVALLGGWAIARWQPLTGRGLYWVRLGAAGALALSLTAGALAFGTTGRVAEMGLAALTAGLALCASAVLALAQPDPGTARRKVWTVAVGAVLALDLMWASAGLHPGGPGDLYQAGNPTADAVRAVIAAERPALPGWVAGAPRLYFPPPVEYALKFERLISFESYARSNPEELRASLLPNITMRDQIGQAGNFDPMVTQRFATYMRVMSETRAATLLALADVGALATTSGVVPAERPPQRIRVVSRAVQVDDPAAAEAAIRAPDFDPDAWVVLEPGHTAAVGSPSALTGGDPNGLDFTVSLPRAGWVVLSDSYYPGWAVWVDNSPAPLHPANLAFRAVPVPAGTHTISFRFQPVSVWAGAGVSLVGVGILIGLAGLSRLTRLPQTDRGQRSADRA